jgi:hypothetical protein
MHGVGGVYYSSLFAALLFGHLHRIAMTTCISYTDFFKVHRENQGRFIYGRITKHVLLTISIIMKGVLVVYLFEIVSGLETGYNLSRQN